MEENQVIDIRNSLVTIYKLLSQLLLILFNLGIAIVFLAEQVGYQITSEEMISC